MLRRKRLKSYPSLHLLIGNCFTYLWKWFHLLMENCFKSYTSHASAWSRLCNRPLTTSASSWDPVTTGPNGELTILFPMIYSPMAGIDISSGYGQNASGPGPCTHHREVHRQYGSSIASRATNVPYPHPCARTGMPRSPNRDHSSRASRTKPTEQKGGSHTRHIGGGCNSLRTHATRVPLALRAASAPARVLSTRATARPSASSWSPPPVSRTTSNEYGEWAWAAAALVASSVP